MHRRGFLQTTGLGAVAALVGRSATAAPASETPAPPVKQLPKRSEVAPSDTWDLSSLYPGDAAWDQAFTAWQKQIEGYAAFPGKLAESPQKLAACLQFDLDVDRAGDRLGTYAMLKTAEDQSNSVYQRMQGRFTQTASRAGAGRQLHPPGDPRHSAGQNGRISAGPGAGPLQAAADAHPALQAAHLGEKEEKLLAMQTEMAQAAAHIFRQLNDTDIKFGTVRNEKGQPIELSHAHALRRCSIRPTARFARRRSTPITTSTRPTSTRWRPR